MKHYGITQQDLKSTRKAMKVALMCVNQSPEDMNAWHGYYMAQLAQTYRTRKVMYDNNTRNYNAPGIFAYPYGVPKGLSQGS